MDATDVTLSPTLAVMLDLWGQVIAYRAGAIAQPEWFPGSVPQYPKPKAKAPPKQVKLSVRQAIAYGAGILDPWWLRPQTKPNSDPRRRLTARKLAYIRRNHLGLDLTPWDLCEHWRRLIQMEHGFPRSATLSVETKRMLNELEGAGSGPGSVGRMGDLRSVQCAHITACQLLLGHPGHRGATANMRSLVCWLHAVPWFADRPTDIPEWCAARFGGQSSERLVQAITSQYSRWVICANSYVRSSLTASGQSAGLPNDAVPIELHLTERQVWEAWLRETDNVQNFC